jgi:hypothetical protein
VLREGRLPGGERLDGSRHLAMDVGPHPHGVPLGAPGEPQAGRGTEVGGVLVQDPARPCKREARSGLDV